MKTSIACLLLGLLLLTPACGRHVYTSSSRSAEQEERDYNECAYEAEKATGNLSKKEDRSDRVENMIDLCMKSKGYKR